MGHNASLNVDDFEAASGDMEGDVEPTFISLRATGDDVIRGWLTVSKATRTLRCEYEILNARLSDDDVRWLFVECYVKTLTRSFLAGKIDTIVLVPRARPKDAATVPYPS